MTTSEEQEFLNNLEKKLWTAADKLRSTLDAAQYKHAVLGLIFLKYVSDAFDIRRQELEKQFRDPAHPYYMDPEEFGGLGPEYELDVAYELEQRDYYLETNTFWVPATARWEFCKTTIKPSSAGRRLPIKTKTAKLNA